MSTQVGRIDPIGAYPLRTAAAYAHLSPRTAERWVNGYDYKHRGARRRSSPIRYLAGVDQEIESDRLLNFEQLLTLLLVKAFKDRGLGLATIKRAAERARSEYNIVNPFVSRRFRSDGYRVFLDLDVPGKERQLLDVLTDQREFQQIVEPSLFKDVVFVDERAREWWPLGLDRHVVVSPDRQFGAPHIAGKGTRTDVIAEGVAAEGGGQQAIMTAAEWYGLTLAEGQDAVAFEGRWLQS